MSVKQAIDAIVIWIFPDVLRGLGGGGGFLACCPPPRIPGGDAGGSDEHGLKSKINHARIGGMAGLCVGLPGGQHDTTAWKKTHIPPGCEAQIKREKLKKVLFDFYDQQDAEDSNESGMED
ncbi:hypothetical protein B0H16DRAFT_1482400 [Mycena metata]|uniref:Uncharacterized protein n=1 Tax=Mycena metata TaxID=1033252 RepID=A0AAD7GU06_9AGAR|nr:hypothetical protein B0H16DRAFT_1482400 [Mycena metata]